MWDQRGKNSPRCTLPTASHHSEAAAPACPFSHGWVQGMENTHLGCVLSHGHVGAAAGLHGEAHDLAFHEDEEQNKDLRSPSGAGVRRVPGGRSHSQPVPTPLAPACQPLRPQRAQTSQFSPLRAPGTLRSAPLRSAVGPGSPDLHRGCRSRPLPTDPGSPRALQPHEGPEPDSEGLPTDSPGHISREPYRPLGPRPTAAPESASRGPHGLAWCGSADSAGRTDAPARPAPSALTRLP